MTTINQKVQILESLNSLDRYQTEQVMQYIKNLMHVSADEASHNRFKREALKEIRQALGDNRQVISAF